MSRIPRYQEHLKTGFTAEAMSAARFRANAGRAAADGLAHLAEEWRRLAAEKDRLAILLLEAAGQVRDPQADLATALADERYENEVLYPKMIRDVDGPTADTFLAVIAAQREHLKRLEDLRARFMAATGDVDVPSEVGAGTHGSQPG